MSGKQPFADAAKSWVSIIFLQTLRCAPLACGAAAYVRSHSLSTSRSTTRNSHKLNMKTHRNPGFARHLAAAVSGVALFTGALQAAPFLYSSGDLVLAFRQTGNASDYAVNIGKATNYNALPEGTTLTITNLSTTQLNAAFPSVNGIKWSVAGANRPPFDSNYPVQTIWAGAGRAEADVQSSAWLRKGQFVQGTAASQIDAIGANAAASSSSQPAGANNTAFGVVIPVNTDYTISPLIGDAGDYASTFQGDVQATTADDFDGDVTNVSRLDLYELQPGTTAAGTLNTPGRYLGYFELKSDGSLTFNTGAPAAPAPTITNIARDGEVAVVTFTTVNGATYKLRSTNEAGLNTPVSTWTAGPTITGTGAELSLQETSADGIRFYAIEVEP